MFGCRVVADDGEHPTADDADDRLQPREALLKYAEQGEKDPQWTAGACLRVYSRKEKELTQGVLVHQQIDCLFSPSPSPRTLTRTIRAAPFPVQPGSRTSRSLCSRLPRRTRRRRSRGRSRGC